MQFLKQSTTINIKLGPFVDSVDGYTAKTGLTPSVKLSKNGGTLAARNSATAVAHDADGWYTVELDTTDTGTLGRLLVCVVGSSSSLPVWQEYMVVTANIWDSLCSTDVFDVSVVQFNGTNGTFSSGRPEVNTSHIAGSAVSASTAQIGVNVVNFGGSAGTFASGRPEVNTSHIAGSAVSTSSAQIGVNVVNAGGTAWGSGAITSGAFASGAITAAAIATDAIGAAELAADAVTEIAAAVAAGSVASVVGAVGSVTGNVGGNVVGSVGSVATGGITAASIAADAIGASELAADAATEIATAVWASATRTVTAATNITSTGGTTVPQTGDSYARIGANGASLSAIPWNAAWDAEVQSECADALTAYGPTTATANDIADAVLSRDVSNVEGTAPEHSLCTTVLAGLEHTIVSTSLTIFRTDGTTPHATKTLTLAPSADAITGIS